MSANTNPSTADFRKTAKTLNAVSIGVAVGGLGITILIAMQMQSQQSQIKLREQEIASQTAAAATAQSLTALFSAHENEVLLINQSLPNQNTIITFLEALSTLIHSYDKEGIVKFSATDPQKINNQLVIPLYLKGSFTSPNLVSFLRQLERLPYIIEVTGIDAKSPQGLGGAADVTIGAMVYVQEPFTQR